MNTTFDQHGINHMTVAISREMTPRGRARHADSDTLFFGGPQPSEADTREMCGFALRKNWQVIRAAFDPADPHAGPIGFDAAITDGVAETFGLMRGRLWKRDRDSAAVLVFPETAAKVRLNAKGKLVVGEMKGNFDERGYDLARQAVVARAARKPGGVPVISPMGRTTVVFDMAALADTFAAA